MAHEFGQVEGDIERLTERALSSALPYGMSFPRFKDKLKSGELALLTETPSKPVMLRDGMSKSWSLSIEGQEALSPEAKSAFLAKAKMPRGAVSGSASSQGSAAYAPSIEETYVPEPVKPDTSDAQPQVNYEYCFEIACSEDTFKKSVGCAFQLGKTKQETMIGRWQTEPTEHGTKYIAHTAFDEPKKLVIKVAESSMGISVPDSVQVNSIGSGVVEEAFIPVVPSVQLGERLGLPTEGYYYHFHNDRLVQEYKLLGEGKWAFYATCSTHEQLNDEQGYNRLQSAILVYWKLTGQDVENQSLVYLEQQITREELDNLNDDWVAQHGIKVDINELLSVSKEAHVERQPDSAQDKPSAEIKTYNKLANSIYDYSRPYLLGSTAKAVNSEGVVHEDLAIANLKEVEEQIEFQLGFARVEESQSLSDYWKQELSGVPSKTKSLIQEHNQHLNDPLIPGEMVIFLTKAPSSKEEKAKLTSLKENSELASEELGKLNPDQVELHQAYFEVLENKLVEYWNAGKPSDAFAYMGATVGTIAPAMQKNLENVSSSLKKIDRLYLDLLAKKIDRSSFARQRLGLKKILDKQLDKLTQQTLKIPIDQGFKESLGINSTKSLIHNADEILKTGSVPELGARVANTAKWITYAEKAGKLSLGLGVASGVYNVTQNCKSLASCTRQAAIETGGVAGGWAGGLLGAGIAGLFVVGLSISAAPVVMLLYAGGALAGGFIGSGAGKGLVEEKYDLLGLDSYLDSVEKELEEGIPVEVETYINSNRYSNFNMSKAF
ncbi:hypothetical protein [Vibrio coralliilyticus]|uniref:hypothetical protein n=1 Tax=Vibrio coralliilyticus TaxID=190893 RepID=UPI0002F2ADE0|nr:hypothetical protein [Vibrio coralliilyticus]